MNKTRKSEHGQALILIVFGMIGLIGMTAVAIDGGSAYSDRRHAQNAADTSVMAAGLTKIRNPSDWSIAEAAGYARAAGNGYDDNGTSNVVHVYQCTDPGSSCALPPAEPYTDSNGNGKYDAGDGCGTTGEPFTDTNGNGVYDGYDPADFVQVTITSHVNTYFARVLGISQITNSVQALAKAVPSVPVCWYNGNALVATQPGCHPPAPNDPFTIGGTSLTVVTGAGGIFVNSNCSNAFTASNGTQISSVNGICVVGGTNVGGGATVNPPADDYCGSQIDPSLYLLPSVNADSCPDPGQIIDTGGHNYVAKPGRYDAVFPGGAAPGPAGTLKLVSGIYCLNNGLNIGSSWNITTDLDGVGEFDGSDGRDEGVLFYIPTDGVQIQGGATVHLGAMNKPGTDPGVKGYLIYLPPTNNSEITINGGSDEYLVGTILAPASLITLNGGASGDSLNLDCQIIGYSIKLTGNGTLNIQYNKSKNGVTVTNPILKPYR